MAFQFGNNISFAWKQLKAGDYTVRHFQANKTWKFNTLSNDVDYYENHNINVYRVLYPENNKYFGNVLNLSSDMYRNSYTSQSIDPKQLWYYLDHNFYTVYSDYRMYDSTGEENSNNYLWETSSLFVLPMVNFGEGIKKGSFSINNYNTNPSYSYNLTDDGFGNLIDNSFDATKFVDYSSCLIDIGFNEKYREYKYKNNKSIYVLDSSHHNNIVRINNTKKITYHNGIPTTDTAEPTGVSAAIHGTYLSIDDYQEFNFNRSNNFAFSFWLNVPVSQSVETYDHNYLFNKNRIKMLRVGDDVIETGSYSSRFPFDIYLTNRTAANPYSIVFRQSSDVESMQVTSSMLATGSWNHVICQKTGSNYEIYINGTLNASTNKIMTSKVDNDHKFYIAGDGTNDKVLSGSLDEVRIYSKGLTSDEITHLYDNSLVNGYAYQTARIGNVFYKQGMVVVSDPRPKYKNSILGSSGSYDYSDLTYGFEGQYKSITTFFEHEIICKIRKSEFNFTQNPSLFSDINLGPKLIDTYASHRDFNPYITTIGLYNEDKDLIAIAKLANPLIKRDDVDMNIIVRFDM